jgi:hypothetical protein
VERSAAIPRATSLNPSAQASRTARCSKTDRPAASEKPTSSGESSSEDAVARRASSAASDLADSTHGTTAGSTACSSTGSSTAGACSMITCALVPLIPKEDTPARHDRPTSGQGRASVSSSTAPADHSTCRDGWSMCRDLGSTPCRSASTVLMTPATPAAAWACPMLDFSDPSSNGRSGSRPRPYVASSACASIGSPSAVPVPWPSTASTSAADNPALASACRITRCWEGPLGAVMPLLAPSWLTAEPRTTASTS